jgi:hypothetical protein
MKTNDKRIVRVVKLARGRVQNVTFTHDRKKRLYLAETFGCPTISIRFDTSDKKFHAFIEGGVLDLPAKDARTAFTKAATRIWYA